MIRVVLVDDHELVRTGFRMILAQQPGIEIVGEAADGEDGLALIRASKPDVAIVDVHMPRLSGIELTERVRKHKLKTGIVILTMVSEAPFPKRLIEAGASGYLTKGGAADELVRAVRQVADGKRYLSPDIAAALALEQIDGRGDSAFDALTTRELDVALMPRAATACRTSRRISSSARRRWRRTNIACSRSSASTTRSRSPISRAGTACSTNPPEESRHPRRASCEARYGMMVRDAKTPRTIKTLLARIAFLLVAR
jgi:DNA-binding NarL/FixJ family response regulator